jgi:hypothetical protein
MSFISLFRRTTLASTSHDGTMMTGKEKKTKNAAAFVHSPVKTTAFVIMAVFFVLFSLAGIASANEPWFHVESASRPSYLPPPAENEEGQLENGKGEIIVTASNLGNAGRARYTEATATSTSMSNEGMPNQQARR